MSVTLVAEGNISPARIVKQGSATGKVLQSASNTSQNFGISHPGTHNPPVTIVTVNLDDGYAAIAGLNLVVYTVGDEAMLELGGTVAAGDQLTADSSGMGIATTSSGDHVVGEAMMSGVSGDLIKVQVRPYVL